jgi:hypothetical protein
MQPVLWYACESSPALEQQMGALAHQWLCTTSWISNTVLKLSLYSVSPSGHWQAVLGVHVRAAVGFVGGQNVRRECQLAIAQTAAGEILGQKCEVADNHWIVLGPD